MNDYISQFDNYVKLADKLIAASSKEEIAEVARILAVNCAQYQLRLGVSLC